MAGTSREQKQRDEQFGAGLPQGVTLRCMLRGHEQAITRLAWSSDATMLASASLSGTVRLWDTRSGTCLARLPAVEEGAHSLAFGPDGDTLAVGSGTGRVVLWSVSRGERIDWIPAHNDAVTGLAFAGSDTLVTGSYPSAIRLWRVNDGSSLGNLSKDLLTVRSLAVDRSGTRVFAGCSDGTAFCWDLVTKRKLISFLKQRGPVVGLGVDPQGSTVAMGGDFGNVNIWDLATGRLTHVLEAHTSPPTGIAFLATCELLATRSKSDDIKLWRSDTGGYLATIREEHDRNATSGFSAHSAEPLLASTGFDDGPVIRMYHVDCDVVTASATPKTVHYSNAKVLLVGDTGVGKTALSQVLMNEPFRPTESTAGRRVLVLDTRDVVLGNNVTHTRETLLWDLAGQPGYRVIHQLHLHEVTVALVVFDARSETDPLAGVRHWVRAVKLAQQRNGGVGAPMRMILVSARNDRGGVSLSEDRLRALLDEFGFDAYFRTSAKEGWGVQELRAAIDDAVDWSTLPVVSSNELFVSIKAFLLDAKETGRLLVPVEQLWEEFLAQHGAVEDPTELRRQFDTCIGRLENRDLVRRLSFGGYLLLQPELLDSYGSAMVNTAKEEPDGLGSIDEDVALSGIFYIPDEHRIKERGIEQLLLHATVEELVRHELALRESAQDGRYLVFPSQFNRDFEDAPDPKGKAVTITFEGPVQSVYATLAVRLARSGMFTAGRAEMWRNAVIFSAKAGGKCGLFLHEFAEAKGRLTLFYPEDETSAETRFHFEEFVLAHVRPRTVEDALAVVRLFLCHTCGDPVPVNYVKRLHDRGITVFECPCGSGVPLDEPRDRLRYESRLAEMVASADGQRDFDRFILSAKGETSSTRFVEWAGGEHVTLAIAFTDLVGSTALTEQIRDEAMNQVRRAHFGRCRQLIHEHGGREIKTIGDSFMIAFRSAAAAIDFALALRKSTGDPRIDARVGIHVGPTILEGDDLFGGTVNFASRIVGSIGQAEIWLSERAKDDIIRLGAHRHEQLRWAQHEDVVLKGFSGTFDLWSVDAAD